MAASTIRRFPGPVMTLRARDDFLVYVRQRTDDHLSVAAIVLIIQAGGRVIMLAIRGLEAMVAQVRSAIT